MLRWGAEDNENIIRIIGYIQPSRTERGIPSQSSKERLEKLVAGYNIKYNGKIKHTSRILCISANCRVY